MEQFTANQQRLQEIDARMASEASNCRKCQVLGDALEQFHGFLMQCPEADPTGEDRQSVQETLGGLRECVRFFC